MHWGECNRRILLVGDKSRWQGGAAGLHYTLLATPHFNCSCIIYNVYFNCTLLYCIVLYWNTMPHLTSTAISIALHSTLLQHNVTPQFNYFIALSGTLLHWAIILINSAALGHLKCASTTQYGTIQYGAIQCSTIRCNWNTTQYSPQSTALVHLKCVALQFIFCFNYCTTMSHLNSTQLHSLQLYFIVLQCC